MKRDPYKNEGLSVGDLVTISFTGSKYHGVTGSVFAIDEATGYAIVDMPKGTELRLEGIKDNAILSGTKKRKGKPYPTGDPQRFPVGWLAVAQGGLFAMEQAASD